MKIVKVLIVGMFLSIMSFAQADSVNMNYSVDTVYTTSQFVDITQNCSSAYSDTFGFSYLDVFGFDTCTKCGARCCTSSEICCNGVCKTPKGCVGE